MLRVSDEILLDDSELEFSFVKSSGSGGQKVNKTNSQVQLRWNLLESSSLSEKLKSRLLDKLSSRLTVAGDIVVVSEKGRSQYQNKQNCIDKFKQLLSRAAFVPKPRKKTRPTRASKERRLKDKKAKSDVKKMRKKEF